MRRSCSLSLELMRQASLLRLRHTLSSNHPMYWQRSWMNYQILRPALKGSVTGYFSRSCHTWCVCLFNCRRFCGCESTISADSGPERNNAFAYCFSRSPSTCCASWGSSCTVPFSAWWSMLATFVSSRTWLN